MSNKEFIEIGLAWQAEKANALKVYHDRTKEARYISYERDHFAMNAEDAYMQVKGSGSIDEDYLKNAAEIAAMMAALAFDTALKMENYLYREYENRMKHAEKVYKIAVANNMAKLDGK